MTDPVPNWIDAVFLASQLYTVPFFALMVFAPSWSATQRLIAQRWWWIALALFCVAFLAYGLFFSGAGLLILTRMFWPTIVNEQTNFALWAMVPASGTHVTFDDLFVMRWIYLREQTRPCSLQLVMGLGWIGAPLGLLAYTAYCARHGWCNDAVVVAVQLEEVAGKP